MLRSSIVAMALLGLSGTAMADLENCGGAQYDPTQVSENYQHDLFCQECCDTPSPRFVSRNAMILDRPPLITIPSA